LFIEEGIVSRDSKNYSLKTPWLVRWVRRADVIDFCSALGCSSQPSIITINPHQNDQGRKGPCFFQRLIAIKCLSVKKFKKISNPPLVIFPMNPISPSENKLFSMILTI
jgi:hypothetical protein